MEAQYENHQQEAIKIQMMSGASSLRITARNISDMYSKMTNSREE
jgi:hypothetical protein